MMIYIYISLICLLLTELSSSSSMLSMLSLSSTSTSSILKRIDENKKHIENLYRIDLLLAKIEDGYDSDSRRKVAKICLELYNLKLGEVLKINYCHDCMFDNDLTIVYDLCGVAAIDKINNNNINDDNNKMIIFKKTSMSSTQSILYLLKDHTNKKFDSNDLNKKMITENKIKSLFKIAETTSNNNNNIDKVDDDRDTRKLVLAAWNENQKDDRQHLSTLSHKIWIKYCTRYRPYKKFTIRVYDSQEYDKTLLAQIKISIISTVNDLLLLLQKDSTHENINEMINNRTLYSIENTILKRLSSDNNTSLLSCGLLPPNINCYLL